MACVLPSGIMKRTRGLPSPRYGLSALKKPRLSSCTTSPSRMLRSPGSPNPAVSARVCRGLFGRVSMGLTRRVYGRWRAVAFERACYDEGYPQRQVVSSQLCVLLTP